MRESILTSIKKLLGIAEECTDFDPDVVMHINTVLMNLRQIGVGPSTGFVIADSSETWTDFLGPIGNVQFSAVKTFVYLKVKQMFDPLGNGAVSDSTNSILKELEYRLYAEAAWPTIEV